MERKAQLQGDVLAKTQSQVTALETKLAAASVDTKAFGEVQLALSEETIRREAVENDLRQKTAEAKDALRRWKQTARELNDFRSSAQGFYIVTDKYLIELAEGLRFNIQNFAIQYFEGNGPDKIKFDETDFFKRYIEPVKDHDQFLQSPERCSSLIQRFLWKVVALHIFDNFRWAGEAGDAARKLATVLRPGTSLAKLSLTD